MESPLSPYSVAHKQPVEMLMHFMSEIKIKPLELTALGTSLKDFDALEHLEKQNVTQCANLLKHTQDSLNLLEWKAHFKRLEPQSKQRIARIFEILRKKPGNIFSHVSTLKEETLLGSIQDRKRKIAECRILLNYAKSICTLKKDYFAHYQRKESDKDSELLNMILYATQFYSILTIKNQTSS